MARGPALSKAGADILKAAQHGGAGAAVIQDAQALLGHPRRREVVLDQLRRHHKALVDHVKPPEDRVAVARSLGLDGSRPVIALLPGSRNKEVAFNLPPMLGAVRLLREQEGRASSPPG